MAKFRVKIRQISGKISQISCKISQISCKSSQISRKNIRTSCKNSRIFYESSQKKKSNFYFHGKIVRYKIQSGHFAWRPLALICATRYANPSLLFSGPLKVALQ